MRPVGSFLLFLLRLRNESGWWCCGSGRLQGSEQQTMGGTAAPQAIERLRTTSLSSKCIQWEGSSASERRGWKSSRRRLATQHTTETIVDGICAEAGGKIHVFIYKMCLSDDGLFFLRFLPCFSAEWCVFWALLSHSPHTLTGFGPCWSNFHHKYSCLKDDICPCCQRGWKHAALSFALKYTYFHNNSGRVKPDLLTVFAWRRCFEPQKQT